MQGLRTGHRDAMHCVSTPYRVFISLIIFFIIFLITRTPASAKNADDLYRDGSFAEAEKAYQQADLDNPADLRFRYDRGCAAYQNKDYQAAEAAFSSVLRRAKDKDMLFRAAYNLGNTAFVQNDFTSAVESYKQAIAYNPGSSEAKYNLELAIKKLEEAKKNPENKDNKSNKKQDQKQGDESQKEEKGKDKDQKGKQDKSKDGQSRNRNSEKDKEQVKDPSGNLNAANPMGEKPKNELSPAAMLDRKKAEALLDNIKEDRAKALRFQIPGGKKGGAASGKNW